MEEREGAPPGLASNHANEHQSPKKVGGNERPPKEGNQFRNEYQETGHYHRSVLDNWKHINGTPQEQPHHSFPQQETQEASLSSLNFQLAQFAERAKFLASPSMEQTHSVTENSVRNEHALVMHRIQLLIRLRQIDGLLALQYLSQLSMLQQYQQQMFFSQIMNGQHTEAGQEPNVHESGGSLHVNHQQSLSLSPDPPSTEQHIAAHSRTENDKLSSEMSVASANQNGVREHHTMVPGVVMPPKSIKEWPTPTNNETKTNNEDVASQEVQSSVTDARQPEQVTKQAYSNDTLGSSDAISVSSRAVDSARPARKHSASSIKEPHTLKTDGISSERTVGRGADEITTGAKNVEATMSESRKPARDMAIVSAHESDETLTQEPNEARKGSSIPWSVDSVHLSADFYKGRPGPKKHSDRPAKPDPKMPYFSEPIMKTRGSLSNENWETSKSATQNEQDKNKDAELNLPDKDAETLATQVRDTETSATTVSGADVSQTDTDLSNDSLLASGDNTSEQIHGVKPLNEADPTTPLRGAMHGNERRKRPWREQDDYEHMLGDNDVQREDVSQAEEQSGKHDDENEKSQSVKKTSEAAEIEEKEPESGLQEIEGVEDWHGRTSPDSSEEPIEVRAARVRQIISPARVILDENGSHMEVYPVMQPDGRYKCSLCDKTFKFAKHVRRHSSTHSQLRNFQCQRCGTPFNRHDSLLRHQSRCGARKRDDVRLHVRLRQFSQKIVKPSLDGPPIIEDVPLGGTPVGVVDSSNLRIINGEVLRSNSKPIASETSPGRPKKLARLANSQPGVAGPADKEAETTLPDMANASNELRTNGLITRTAELHEEENQKRQTRTSDYKPQEPRRPPHAPYNAEAKSSLPTSQRSENTFQTKFPRPPAAYFNGPTAPRNGV